MIQRLLTVDPARLATFLKELSTWLSDMGLAGKML